MRQFAVSAIGRDRPGIVAGVTRTLLEHGVNIASHTPDSSRLRRR